MVCIILGFHRLRCPVAQWLVEPLRVPPRDPPEHRQLQIRKISERPALPDQLGLVRAVDGLGHGVVIRVADRAGRRQRPEFPDPGGVDEADVLRAMIMRCMSPSTPPYSAVHAIACSSDCRGSSSVFMVAFCQIEVVRRGW